MTTTKATVAAELASIGNYLVLSEDARTNLETRSRSNEARIDKHQKELGADNTRINELQVHGLDTRKGADIACALGMVNTFWLIALTLHIVDMTFVCLA